MLRYLKSWITWSWTYLWALWFLLVIALVYTLRGPLKLGDSIESTTLFLSNLTPKFYVALTGTSSLVSGVILIFEWWYFKKYGSSFIETMSFSPLQWFGGGGGAGGSNSDGAASNNGNISSSVTCSSSTAVSTNHHRRHHHHRRRYSREYGQNDEQSSDSDESSDSSSYDGHVPDCKIWRNSVNLLRGAEYNRFTTTTSKEPLTYYDMNLSAQDHQNFFTCESDSSKPDLAIMQVAWRERDPDLRIKAARRALEINGECATASILLAEEEAKTVIEAEQIFRRALKSAEFAYKKSHPSTGPIDDALHKRDTNVIIYIRRRLAMCARRLGRLKEAVTLMRNLIKEFPSMNVMNIHENLIEALLEQQAFADAQAVLARYDEFSLPKSAVICYTAALLKARLVADKFSPDVASRKGLSAAELSAVEAIHKAVEFNPHVPKYLLELKPLILPPEHVVARGDTEAVSYAFWHLAHWKRVDGALALLQCTWEGAFRLLPCPLEKGLVFYPYPSCTEAADRELLPAWHEVSVYPKKELPFITLFTAGLCSGTALLALLTHQYPKAATNVVNAILHAVATPLNMVFEKMTTVLPSNIVKFLASSAKNA